MFRSTLACLALALAACSTTTIQGSTGGAPSASSGGALGTAASSATGGVATTGNSGGSSTGTTAGVSAGGTTGGEDTCALVGQASCDGGCANLRSDNANCGACGNACPLGEGCVDAGCAGGPVCPTGQVQCEDGGSCIDLDTDVAACGSCGHACVACEACKGASCTPQNPLELSGYALEIDAGDTMYPAAELATGDVNGDGLPDLVMINESNAGSSPSLGWSFGRSDGGFDDPHYLALSDLLPFAEGPTQLVVADFDGDGSADVLLVGVPGNRGQAVAFILPGSPGGFTAGASVWAALSGINRGVGVGDINGDGWLDFVVGSDSVYVVLNVMDGGFIQQNAIANPPPILTPNGRFVLADLNGDGLADALAPGDPIVGGYSTETASQLPDGGFSSWFALAGDPGSNWVASYGASAIVSAGNQIGLVTGTADGGLCRDLSAALLPSPDLTQSAEIDLNHDNLPDIVAVGSSSLLMFFRTVDGWDSTQLALPVGSGPGFVVLSDGRVAIGNPQKQQIEILDNRCP